MSDLARSLPLDRLEKFHMRVTALRRACRPYDDNRTPRQSDLAAAIGLSAQELCTRLTGSRQDKTHLSERDVRAIVSTLADWEAITTQAEADELLTLLDCPSFSQAEWQAPPLDRLTPRPTPAPPPPRLHNLPYPVSRFIGRKSLLDEVTNLVAQQRLVTLTGPGGCGKTRLALTVGMELLPSTQDGVWLVELAAVNDPNLLVPTLAQALGVREQAGQALATSLAQFLHARALVLILDNCEHLIDPLATLVHQLLEGAPYLHVLATSREPLNILGEVVRLVPPLAVPASRDRVDMAALQQAEAVQLFLDRAAATVPGFTLTPDNAAAVQAVCVQLDGLPLALELAATRLRALSITQIQALLGDRFRLLSGGNRTASLRHQSLQGALDWSYALLTPAEQRLFRQLGVFTGPFTLEAVAAVAGLTGRVTTQLVTRLIALIEKSLVVHATASQDPYYTLLETIRVYAGERAAAQGEQDVQNRRHGTYYLTLVDRADAEVRGPRQAIWLDLLEMEHPNIRTALGWALAQPDPTPALHLGAALWGFWMIRSHWSEGCRWLEAILEHGADGPPALRARVTEGLGWLNWARSETALARQHYEASLTLYRMLGDDHAMVITLNNLGSLALDAGDHTQAEHYFTKSLALCQEHNDRPGLAMTLLRLAGLVQQQGDSARAHALYSESLPIYREMGNVGAIATCLINVGYAALALGDYAMARAQCAESLTLYRSLNNSAAAANALAYLGYIALASGALGVAATHFAESIRITQDRGFKGVLTQGFLGLASIAARLARPEEAARLCGATVSVLGASGSDGLNLVERQIYDQTQERLRAVLGPAAYETAQAVGAAWPLDTACAASLLVADQMMTMQSAPSPESVMGSPPSA